MNIAKLIVAAHLERRGIELRLGQTVTEQQTNNGILKAVRANHRWIDCRTLFIAAGSVPELGFLHDSGLLSEGCLEVGLDLQTKDRAIWAAGDVVTVVNGGRSTPWTWPQAVVQGRLAAENVYASSPLHLPRLSRVNAMNLGGLSLIILGAPVNGAEHVVFSEPGRNVYREIYHRDGRILGGALIGDISGAGRLHQLMTAGPLNKAEMEEVLLPGHGAFTRSAAKGWVMNRRAALRTAEGAR